MILHLCVVEGVYPHKKQWSASAAVVSLCH